MAVTRATLNRSVPFERRAPHGGGLPCVGLALVVLVVPSLLVGLAQPTSAAKVLEAEKFVLLDTQGKVRAEFGCGAGGPSLALFDERGKCRARLVVEADGASRLNLYDKDGHSRAVLRVRAEGKAVLEGDDNAGAPAAPARPHQEPPDPARPASTHMSPAATVERDPSRQATEDLYRRLCAGCHSADGRGRRMRASMPSLPDFAASAWQASRTDVQLTVGILNGRGREMPAFDDKLSSAQARELVALIRSLGPSPPKPADVGASDFESRLRQLQVQWEELRRQAQEAALPPRGP